MTHARQNYICGAIVVSCIIVVSGGAGAGIGSGSGIGAGSTYVVYGSTSVSTAQPVRVKPTAKSAHRAVRAKNFFIGEGARREGGEWNGIPQSGRGERSVPGRPAQGGVNR